MPLTDIQCINPDVQYGVYLYSLMIQITTQDFMIWIFATLWFLTKCILLPTSPLCICRKNYVSSAWIHCGSIEFLHLLTNSTLSKSEAQKWWVRTSYIVCWFPIFYHQGWVFYQHKAECRPWKVNLFGLQPIYCQIIGVCEADLF